MTTTRLPSFKAYDIRGRVPEELSEDLAYRIGRATAECFQPRKMVIGRDMRTSSAGLADALARGFMDAGVDVVNIGLCGTEMVYFAAFDGERDGIDGGVMVTASHNPAGYNGMKLVQRGAVPISGDTGLFDIEQLARNNGPFTTSPTVAKGTLVHKDVMPAFVQHLLSWVDVAALKPLTLVVNAGNGCAGLVVDALQPHLPFTFIKLFNEPDGTFPNGVPNPLLEENRAPTADAVRAHKADLGIAWDGDFDRCFFFDNDGGFVEGYYMVGLFAQELLRDHPGAAIIHDPRLTWNTIEMVGDVGGRIVQSKTGHAFIKERMRKEDAIYGGEMSAHHYFRRFAYCDSGMIPWLLLTSMISRSGKSLKQLVQERQARYPASGELNLHLPDAKAALVKVRAAFASEHPVVDETDGLSLEMPTWRLNVRSSNTEPVVRVNVETRGDEALMRAKTEAVLAVLRAP